METYPSYGSSVDRYRATPSASPDNHVRIRNILDGIRSFSSSLAGSRTSFDLDSDNNDLLLVERATDRPNPTPYWQDINKYSPKPVYEHFGSLKYDASFTKFNKQKLLKKNAKRKNPAAFIEQTFKKVIPVRKINEPKPIIRTTPYKQTTFSRQGLRKQQKNNKVSFMSKRNSVVHIKHDDIKKEKEVGIGQSMFGTNDDVWITSASPAELYRKSSLSGSDFGLDLTSFQSQTSAVV